MSASVTIVDYGLGNLFSIQRALQALGAQVELASGAEAIRRAQRLILPGVGAFSQGMQELTGRGLVQPLCEAARSGRPMLGICLGMQLLFRESDEFGVHQGLGLMAGRVARLRSTDAARGRVKVPHIGWSDLELSGRQAGWQGTILEGVAPGDAMYFVHSYVPQPEQEDAVIARMRHGGTSYAAVVEQQSLAGCQFHPEKSGPMGLRLLDNFLRKRSEG